MTLVNQFIKLSVSSIKQRNSHVVNAVAYIKSKYMTSMSMFNFMVAMNPAIVFLCSNVQ